MWTRCTQPSGEPPYNRHMAIPHGFIQDLLSRVDIIDVVGRYVQLKKTGANFSGLCPFHSEKSPSFTVSPSKQFYHCFGCGQHGDAIGFLMAHNGLSFVEAVQELAQQQGLQVPDDHLSPEDRDRAAEQRRQRLTLTDVLEKAVDDYRQQLKSSPEAIAYLQGRGLSGQIAARFGLGYAPNSWRHLASVFADYTSPLLEETGLVIHSMPEGATAGSSSHASSPTEEKRYDRFRHRIMFPIRNVKGECIGFGGRVLGNEKPKYLNSPETPLFSKGRELYGLYEARDALRERGYVLVTEGYMDVVALAQLGFGNAVATLGTACTPDHVHKLFRYTDEVVFSFDGDAAGRRAAHKAMGAALPYATDTRTIKFLFLPPEHDPDSYVRTHGPEAFEALVKQATPLSQFLPMAAAEGCDLDTAEGRARMASHARPLWQDLPEGALRSQLLGELARQVQIPLDDLKALWDKPDPARRSQTQTPPPSSSSSGGSARESHFPHGGRPAWRSDRVAASPGYVAPASSPKRGRSAPSTKADHALRLLLLNMPLWESLPPATQAMLCELPAPHGPLFAWLDAQYQEYGALGWGALQDSLPAAPGGTEALALVQRFQAMELHPSSQETQTELRSVLKRLELDELGRAIEEAIRTQDIERFKTLDARRTALRMH